MALCTWKEIFRTRPNPNFTVSYINLYMVKFDELVVSNYVYFDISKQQLQLWAVWKSHRSGPFKQSWFSSHRSSHFIQISYLVLDDPSITKAFLPRCHYWKMEPICRWPISQSSSWIRCHHKHHQWWPRMWSWEWQQGPGSNWVLQEVLWNSWS